jgi:hypothetical protein
MLVSCNIQKFGDLKQSTLFEITLLTTLFPHFIYLNG